MEKRKFEALRAKAEKLISQSGANIDKQEEVQADLDKLMEELYFSQIELEIQNEELRDFQIKLNDEKRRYSDIYHNSPIGYIHFNSSGIITGFNLRTTEILGLPTNKLLRKSFYTFLDNEDLTNFKNYLHQIFQKNQNDQIKLELSIKNGKKEFRRLRLISRTYITDNEIDPVSNTTMEDITDYYLTTNDLVRTNAYLEASMSAGDMAWWELNLPDGTVYFNENKVLMLGHNPKDFTHYNHFMNLLHPEDYHETLKAMTDHIVGTKSKYEMDYRIKHINGNYLWYHDVGKIVYRRGDKIKLTGIVIDITQRKETELALIESEERFRTISEDANEGILLLNSDGVILFANQASENIFKKSAKDITGLDFLRTLDCSREFMEFENIFNQWKFTGKIPNSHAKLNLEIITAFKEKKYIELSISTVYNKFGWQAICIVNDISKLKETIQKLNEINATKDKFFSIIGHDLRNPFGVIMGFSDLLKKNINKYDNEKKIDFITNILNSATSAYKLLENLLEWSRSQTGKIDFEPAWHPTIELVENAYQLLSSQAITKNITLDLDFGNDADEIYCDINMMHTILRNLITNAIKFTPQGGNVKISTISDEIYTTLIISDNGIGMDNLKLDKLFKISEKVQTPGTNDEKGTGLGLLLCNEFVEKHQGQITVTSEINIGTTFILKFPKPKPIN